jgi:glycosyltransferase 2 family protein
MKAVTKKTVALVLKVAVLAAILIYAARQLQMDDELAFVDSAATTVEGEAGRPVAIEPGTKLRVLRAGAARTSSGLVVLVEASDRRFERLPGIRTAIKNLDLGWLALALAMYGPALFLMGPRWHVLLLAIGENVPFWTVVRLQYVSFFFNTFMPGGASGDVVKAVYVARHADRKTETATMVLVDRFIGLFGLLAMAGLAVAVDYSDMRGIARPVGVLSLAAAVFVLLFYSPLVRRLTRYEGLLARLPKADVWQRVDAALFGLRTKKRALASAFALTVLLQVMEVLGVYFAGKALGLSKATLANYFVFVPVGYLVNAIPLSFGGLGLMEGAYMKLFSSAAIATASQGFALGVLARLMATAWSLPGAFWALFPPKAAHAKMREP